MDQLEQKYSLGTATHVLLSGGSAGGVGTFRNVDWLTKRLPHAVVKAAPDAGWFVPAALPSDPQDYPGAMPSDWAHFAAGTHGGLANRTGMEFVIVQLYDMKDVLPPACIRDHGDNWAACFSVDALYRYIAAPLYVIENQYDSNQIYSQEGVPKPAASASEQKLVESYVRLYGEAMRNSTQQVLQPKQKKARPDGLFHPSCLQHGVSQENAPISGQHWLPLLGDWYFERDQLKQYHQLVETCPASAAGLPCNAWKACKLQGGGGSDCAAKLADDGCLAVGHTRASCELCAMAHRPDMAAAGCTDSKIKTLCKPTAGGADVGEVVEASTLSTVGLLALRAPESP